MDIPKRIRRLAIPALGSLAVEPLYILTDTAIVGRISTSALGGLALASTVLFTSFWILTGLEYGMTAHVGRHHGAGQHAQAARLAVQGLWAAAYLGAGVAALLWFGADPLLRLLGGRGEVLEAARTYLRISALGVPFQLVLLVGHGYYRGIENTRLPFVNAAASNIFNAGFEIWLVFGLGTGIAGSAWSTVAAQGAAAVWFVWLISRRAHLTGAGFGFSPAVSRRLAHTGGILAVRTGALLTATAFATSIAARISDASLAAHQITFQLYGLLSLSIDALAVAGQSLVSAGLGSGDHDFVGKVGRTLLRYSVGVGVATAAVLFILRGHIGGLFTADPNVVALTATTIGWLASLQILGAVVFTYDGLLIGANRPQWLASSTVLALVAFAPVAMWAQRWGIGGVWAALNVWLLARLVVLARGWSKINQ